MRCATPAGTRRSAASTLAAASQADYLRNLVYSLIVHNFNPVMAIVAEAPGVAA